MLSNNVVIGIYKIESPTKRIYIGQSIDVYNRWDSYKKLNSKNKSQTKLWRSLLKYGCEAHVFSIIEVCSKDELSSRERYWQIYYNCITDGLNCKLQNTKEFRAELSEETKVKISKSILRRNYKVPESRKKELREYMKGNKYALGRKRKDEEKRSISETYRTRGLNKGELNPMYNKKGVDNHSSKIIIDINTGIFYFGVREASEGYGISFSSLKKMICGNRKNRTSLRYV